eukprot:tig00020964_g16817.t1
MGVDAFGGAFEGASLESFWASLYLTLITVYTVGYGDVTPRTAAGRAVVVFASALGTWLTALLVAVSSQTLQLSAAEQRVRHAAPPRPVPPLCPAFSSPLTRGGASPRRPGPPQMMEAIERVKYQQALRETAARTTATAAFVRKHEMHSWLEIKRRAPLGAQLGMDSQGRRPTRVELEVSDVRSVVHSLEAKASLRLGYVLFVVSLRRALRRGLGGQVDMVLDWIARQEGRPPRRQRTCISLPGTRRVSHDHAYGEAEAVAAHELSPPSQPVAIGAGAASAEVPVISLAVPPPAVQLRPPAPAGAEGDGI